jgi:hypothetical protein
MLTLSAGELIKASVRQRSNGVLDRKTGSAEKNPAWLATRLLWFIRRTAAIVAEDRLILSGVALVSVMKSSDLRNHYDAPAFWLLHGPRIPEHLWPAPDEFGSRGSRTLACPRLVTKMFAGLMSRCTILTAWAASRVSAISIPATELTLSLWACPQCSASASSRPDIP